MLSAPASSSSLSSLSAASRALPPHERRKNITNRVKHTLLDAASCIYGPYASRRCAAAAAAAAVFLRCSRRQYSASSAPSKGTRRGT